MNLCGIFLICFNTGFVVIIQLMLLAREIIVQIDVICVFIYHIQQIIALYIMFIDEIAKQTIFLEMAIDTMGNGVTMRG